jgi:CubicO group peptidase (beta-lactamase class C family)
MMSTSARSSRSPYLSWVLSIALVLVLPGCAGWRPDLAARTATGFTSHVMCDEIFVSGLPAPRAFDDRIRSLPGLRAFAWALDARVDDTRREVSVRLGGGFESRARFTDALGCTALPASEPAPTPPEVAPPRPPRADAAGERPIDGAGTPLAAVLDAAVPGAGAGHRTRAIVVMHEGRVIGERYADGVGITAPLLGFSLGKSVTNALIGVLVRQGRLQVDAHAPVQAWRGADNPRGAITVAHLLRQTSGLALVQDNSGFDMSSQIMYTVRDKAAASARAPLEVPPGTRWVYADPHYLLLSRIVRDAVGGTGADVERFMRTELFEPIGMHHARIDFDATGTGNGAAHVLASARDWARFGQLYLDDGLAGSRRILPEGWVAWSTRATPDTGYAAGFWTQRPGRVPHWGVPWSLAGAPPDTFFGRGFMGQFVVVIPSRRMVIVRLASATERGDDIEETDRIVTAILAAAR